jgi:endonuclease/exonuclease/phosphatase (EEP) superfamily protein YafD
MNGGAVRMVTNKRLKAGAGVAGGLLVAWAVVAALGLAGYLGWQVELFANFSIVPILAVGLGALLLVWCGSRVAAALGGVAMVVVAAGLIVPKPVLPPGNPKEPALKFATWNAYLGQLDPKAALRWIESAKPDVIAFTEITQQLHGILEKLLKSQYPYTLGDPRSGPGGLAIFSKIPITQWGQNEQRAGFGWCDLQWPNGPVCRVIIVHPPSPVHGAWYGGRARTLHAIAVQVVRDTQPTIVLGDFNSTWADTDFRAFLSRTGLAPASGYLSTWHAALPELLRIPIDHVLARPQDFRAITAEAGTEGGGSDHLPVMAGISLAPKVRPDHPQPRKHPGRETPADDEN